MTHLSAQNPLDFPEIRALVSSFVSRKDAFACVHVSKSWTDDFLHHIWHSVDFDVHTEFDELDPAAVERHVGLIRVVKHLRTLQHLESLLCPSVCNISELVMHCEDNTATDFIALYPDLLRMNSSSLRSLSFHGEKSQKHVFPVDVLFTRSQHEGRQSPSKLKSFRVQEVILSRDSFTNLLQGCPSLTSVDLQLINFVHGPRIDTFQHQNITELVAPIKLVFQGTYATTVSAPGESLLAHFPNLVSWTGFNLEPTPFAPAAHIKAEVEMCCPVLDSIDTWRTPKQVLLILLNEVFIRLRAFGFDYTVISTSIISALLLHGSTLQVIVMRQADLEYDADGVSLVDNHFVHSAKSIQLLPRLCSQLKVLRLEGHEMDMDWVEEVGWTCQGLRRLAVRFGGLDTKQKITRALGLWRAGRKNNFIYSGIDNLDDGLIEVRTARHLLKFKDLERVWLGTTWMW